MIKHDVDIAVKLRGMTIGDNSVAWACHDVTKTISANEIWAGKLALFIKNISLSVVLKRKNGEI